MTTSTPETLQTAGPARPGDGAGRTGRSSETSPAGESRPGAFSGKRHHTDKGMERLVRLGKAAMADPARRAILYAAKQAKSPWTPARIVELREAAAAGVALRALARRFGCSADTVSYHARQHNIDMQAVAVARMEAGAAVLREFYAQPIPVGEVLAKYRQARGRVTGDAMRQHAERLMVPPSWRQCRGCGCPTTI